MRGKAPGAVVALGIAARILGAAQPRFDAVQIVRVQAVSTPISIR